MITLPLVRVHDDVLTVTIQGAPKHFMLQSLPAEFIEWQIHDRRSLFQALAQGVKPGFFSPHIPTLLTLDRMNDDFPLNAASKGVGLVPNDPLISTMTKQLKRMNAELQQKDFSQSLPDRLQAMELLYGDMTRINRRALGGLEIFETRSFLNIAQDPRVSLFFVGGSPTYKSYQLNCIAEIIDEGHVFYEFVRTIRSLFEEASFHFQQPKYPYAIKYHVVQVLDKSLRVRGA